MKLYLISQDKNNGNDTYDAAVVAANNENDARQIHPSPLVTHVSDGKWMGIFTGCGEYENDSGNWVSYSDIDCITVEYLGETEKQRGVILAS